MEVMQKTIFAFNHNILLQTETYGTRGPAFDVISSYLYNRQHLVDWNRNLSCTYKVKIGVPQGSLLGEIPFVLYTNNLVHNIPKTGIFTYADNTPLLHTSTCNTIFLSTSQTSLQNAQIWCENNGLFLNVEKTQNIVLSTRHFQDLLPLSVLTWIYQ